MTEDSQCTWIQALRKEFCPAEMIDSNGDLNKSYFSDFSGVRIWQEEDEEKLKQALGGISAVGGTIALDQIQKEHFPHISTRELRVKVMEMMQVQHLTVGEWNRKWVKRES